MYSMANILNNIVCILCNFIWWQGKVDMIISYYEQISNHSVLYLKLIQYYMSINLRRCIEIEILLILEQDTQIASLSLVVIGGSIWI